MEDVHMYEVASVFNKNSNYIYIQRDSKIWTQFRTSLFSELYVVYE